MWLLLLWTAGLRPAAGVPPAVQTSTGRAVEGTMDAPKTVGELCVERGIDARKLAELSNVDEQRVAAIVLGRWTPSPEERDAIAAAFGLTRDQVIWGHTTPVQHLYGQGPA
jgi:hypothetical protein